MTARRSKLLRRTGMTAAAVAWVAILPIGGAVGATTAPAAADGEPQQGGTLVVAGGPDVLFMDPTAAYSAADYQFQRMTLRGLFDYRASGSLEEKATPLPDIAVEVPTQENGGISADGLTYTIELREGVMWNVDEPRPVVAEDVVRGVKRMCNPVVGSAARDYYLNTIAGLREFCEPFAEVAPEVEPIREYIESNDVTGVRAVDERTVEFTLIQPASDFVYILALFRFAAPQPVEYLDYLADGPELRQNIIENGPYQVVEYVPDQSYVLERNPNWDPETDDLREAYVDRIEITLGQENEAVFQQIIAGTVDMQWGETTVPTQEIPALLAAGDERLVIEGAGAINPYIVINTLSPNAEGAYGNVLVRQALNFAVDKEAVQQILGGPDLAELAFHILPPQVAGSEDINPLDVPPGGDPERARELLAEAGYPDGLPLKLLYTDEQEGRTLAALLEQVLGDAGFDVELVFAQRNAFYGDYLLNHEFTESGGWDIAAVSWFADFYAGRSYIPILLDGRGYESGTPNYGGYNNDELNAAIDEALAAATPDEAAALWAQADAIATEDAAWVPVAWAKTPTLHGERVGGFEFHLVPRNGDFTNIWLEE
jgi:peptide/nickel transport system substrate-binding protein